MPAIYSWVRYKVPQVAGETEEAYEQRRAEIDAIIEGFRWNRFSAEESDAMEKRLQALKSGVPVGELA
ncbi:hypothetical protein GCM10011321_17490 [Youhaiella tibetensis]|uniref:Uncharacterized protein n=1 Tax=Paradevosia tibetensis TaxID=1447062 RepID=A0A5B9DMC1_9HYPH|nr:hypothetical protein [Youhaiella tibetensis]AKR55063.1 hypothetical protein XM25_04410 [Devosia sp. H5989]QEE20166.1 hypothetical protein FNA67_08245 [Youhaiella tibetensis]GGF26553.1 hypothetical protein GCM10011321_17490 [Youhaiella tibetensis]